MTLNRSTFPLPLLLLATACAPDIGAPAGQHQVYPIDYGVTELKDAAAVACDNAPVSQAVQQYMAANDMVGCNIAVAVDDDIVFIDSIGSAELDPNTLQSVRGMDARMASGVASVSKELGVVALMKLVEDGWLLGTDIDDIRLADVQALYGGFEVPGTYPSWILDVTLGQLTSHTAGIDDAQWLEQTDLHTTTGVGLGTWVNWANPAFGLTPSEQALEHPGAHPRLAMRALVPPAKAAYTPGLGEEYSNVGYAYVAAVIDAIVTDPAFTGYGDLADDVEPGYESWVWYVWTDGGTDFSDGLLTPALMHPWRESLGDIRDLPAGYESSATPASDWGYWGWEAGSGGWTMTVGDLARVEMAQAQDRFISAESWDVIRTHTSEVGGGDYGHGYQMLDVFDAGHHHYYYGHGGGIRGYSAGTFRVQETGYDGTPVVAFLCNTQPYKPDHTPKAIQRMFAHTLWMAYLDHQDDTVCTTSSAGGLVSQTYMPTWLARAEETVEQEGIDAAIDDAAVYTRDEDVGAAYDALEDGDGEAAAACMLSWLGYTGWTCGAATDPTGGTGTATTGTATTSSGTTTTSTGTSATSTGTATGSTGGSGTSP